MFGLDIFEKNELKILVYIVTENWWPPGKSEEVGKLYIEAFQKFPDDTSISKPVIQAAAWAVKDGMHSITISAIEPGKVKEAMDIAYNRLLMFSVIDGYRYVVHIAYNLIEAMPLIGLNAP
jgi:hypothetical protein